MPTEDGAPTIGPSKECPDFQKAPGDYYLNREQVDKWAKEILLEKLRAADPTDDEAEPNPCESRWSNMITEIMARMWGIFDEMGIFLALCHHGFVLVVADMVQSGEL